MTEHDPERMPRMPRETMRAVCGGEMPHADGFAWFMVEEFRLEDGAWEPYGNGEILPGPGLVIEVKEKP